MAVVVVGGSGRGVGKTALVCGLLAALPEFRWTAVKITTHVHAGLPAIHEETAAGQGTDTARYLAAGAQRAFLVTAPDTELARRLRDLRLVLEAGTNVVFESNRVLSHFQPDLCLAIESGAATEYKSSFRFLEHQKRVVVRLGDSDSQEDIQAPAGVEMVFRLAAFERLPGPMQDWMRARLGRPTI